MRVIDKPYKWFESLVTPTDDIGLRNLYRIFMFALFVIVVVFCYDLVLTRRHGGEEPLHGVFGDFFGGVVNPILTFLTFMGLLVTIVIQKVELKETREELARSADALDQQVKNFAKRNSEEVFLKLIDMRVNLVSSFRFGGPRDPSSGVECFNVYRSILRDIYSSVSYSNDFETERHHVCAMWERFDVQMSSVLSRYFSNVEITLKYMRDSGLNVEPYSSIYVSGFSHDELSLLFYKCVCAGDNEFSASVKEIDLFCSMGPYTLLERGHAELLNY